MTKSVPVGVVGARSLVRRLVEARGHGAHGVEQHRQRPIELLAAAGEDHVLLAHLDHFHRIADAMVRGRASRRDRIVDALDLEPGGERRRRGRRHRLGDGKRPDPLRALGAGDIGGLDDSAGRRPARAHDDAGHLVRDFALLEAGVADRLLHGDVVPGGAAAEEAHGAAIDRLLGVEAGRAVHLAAETELGISVGARNARLGIVQARQNFLGAVADR